MRRRTAIGAAVGLALSATLIAGCSSTSGSPTPSSDPAPQLAQIASTLSAGPAPASLCEEIFPDAGEFIGSPTITPTATSNNDGPTLICTWTSKSTTDTVVANLDVREKLTGVTNQSAAVQTGVPKSCYARQLAGGASLDITIGASEDADAARCGPQVDQFVTQVLGRVGAVKIGAG